MTENSGEFKSFREEIADKDYKEEFVTEEEVRELIVDMHALAERMEKLTKEGKVKKAILKIIWNGFTEVQQDVKTYLED